jgi:hypothetical protein
MMSDWAQATDACPSSAPVSLRYHHLCYFVAAAAVDLAAVDLAVVVVAVVTPSGFVYLVAIIVVFQIHSRLCHK